MRSKIKHTVYRFSQLIFLVTLILGQLLFAAPTEVYAASVCKSTPSFTTKLVSSPISGTVIKDAKTAITLTATVSARRTDPDDYYDCDFPVDVKFLALFTDGSSKDFATERVAVHFKSFTTVAEKDYIAKASTTYGALANYGDLRLQTSIFSSTGTSLNQSSAITISLPYEFRRDKTTTTTPPKDPKPITDPGPAATPPKDTTPAQQNQASPGADVAEESIGTFLCVPSKGSSGGKDLYTCINKLYKFTVAFGGIGAVLMLVIAGYMYMSGSSEQIGKAKSMIGTSIWGLAIFIASYAFLRLINPSLVQFKTIQPPLNRDVEELQGLNERNKEYCSSYPNLCKDGAPVGNPSVGNPGDGGVSKDHEDTSCAKSAANCADLKTAGVTCKNNCQAQKILVEKIKQLADKMKPASIIITEAYPATSSHKDGCHATGACVDISINPANEANWIKACQSVPQVSGLNYLNELLNQANNQNIQKACGKLIKGGRGDHLHVFLTE